MRIAIIGNGRMGAAVAAAARAQGHAIHTMVTRAENQSGAALTPDRLVGSDVAIEFTNPKAVVPNLERLIDVGVPVITGTTGWLEELPRIEEQVRSRGGALLHATNFAVGVQVFLRAARTLALEMRRWDDFDATILEHHHINKVDAPSGTAFSLQHALAQSDSRRPFPITSIRSGSTPGTHTLTYAGPHETIAFTHSTRNRTAFAAGALLAAEWLPGRRGVFHFSDMLFREESR